MTVFDGNTFLNDTFHFDKSDQIFLFKVLGNNCFVLKNVMGNDKRTIKNWLMTGRV